MITHLLQGHANIKSKHLTLVIFEVITGINDNFNGNLTVYPNPFTNEIKFKGAENVKHVIITSITGQVLKDEVIGQVNQINISELFKGIYDVNFMNDNAEKSTKEMIKQLSE